MKLSLLFVLVSFISCQNYNSNTGDDVRYEVVDVQGTAEFKAAYIVLKNRCASCHSGYHSSWGGLQTEQAWIDQGYVVAGDPDNSSLINKTKNFGASYSNMPLDSGSIPTAEYTSMVNWVENIQP